MGPPLVTRQVGNLLVVHFIGRLSLETKPRPKSGSDQTLTSHQINVDDKNYGSTLRWFSTCYQNRTRIDII